MGQICHQQDQDLVPWIEELWYIEMLAQQFSNNRDVFGYVGKLLLTFHEARISECNLSFVFLYVLRGARRKLQGAANTLVNNLWRLGKLFSEYTPIFVLFEV